MGGGETALLKKEPGAAGQGWTCFLKGIKK